MFRAWRRFSKGKRNSPDVARFELRLEEELVFLQERLSHGVWTADPYREKRIADPKPRIIHVASIRDRVFFQAVYQQLYQVFEKTFIHDSYASRKEKGTHAGVKRFGLFARKVSLNYRRQAFVLKCDIRKFFDNIDHELLCALISKHIMDGKFLALIRRVIESFALQGGKGLPLGNVTSQIFANIYLNELDQFVKHILKTSYYIRYCDDFVLLHQDEAVLCKWLLQIHDFLRDRLLLELHPNKVTTRKLRQGTDFLGYDSLQHYSVLRTKTKKRMLKRLTLLAGRIHTDEDFAHAEPVIRSYLGLLAHCKGKRLRKTIELKFKEWF